MKLPKSFREIRRKISQFVETEYWYKFRKVGSEYWYDEDAKKFVKYTKKQMKYNFPYKAGENLASTWEGDYDILSVVLLKIDHMFYNLKNYGNEMSYYFDFPTIDKYGNDNDKNLISKLIAKRDLSRSKGIWLKNIEVDKEESASGNAHLYIRYFADQKKLVLCEDYDEQIPAEKIPKSKKMYILDTADLSAKREAPQYFTRKTKILEEWSHDIIFSNYKFLEDFIIDSPLTNAAFRKYSDKDISTALIYTFNEPEIPLQDIHKLSKKLREHARGQRIKIQQILHLRHMIKKLLSMNDTDDKYYSMWKDIKDDEERSKQLKSATELYRKDRKELYLKIAEFLAENGDSWWD